MRAVVFWGTAYWFSLWMRRIAVHPWEFDGEIIVHACQMEKSFRRLDCLAWSVREVVISWCYLCLCSTRCANIWFTAFIDVIEALSGALLRDEVPENFTIRRDQTSCIVVRYPFWAIKYCLLLAVWRVESSRSLKAMSIAKAPSFRRTAAIWCGIWLA